MENENKYCSVCGEPAVRFTDIDDEDEWRCEECPSSDADDYDDEDEDECSDDCDCNEYEASYTPPPYTPPAPTPNYQRSTPMNTITLNLRGQTLTMGYRRVLALVVVDTLINIAIGYGLAHLLMS